MVDSLPEELLEQAELLLTLPPSQANLRRAVSNAYYSVFHLLIRATVLKWGDTHYRARMARMFEHDRMKKVSGAAIKNLGSKSDQGQSDAIELSKVAQAFINLQQARHDADYNLEWPLDPADAIAQVERAKAAFISWMACNGSEVAREYLFSLLLKEKERG